MDLLRFFLSSVCYVFVPICLYVLCGHLLGKGWPLGSRLWCLTVNLSLSHWYPGSGVVLDFIDSWSLHPYLLSKTDTFKRPKIGFQNQSWLNAGHKYCRMLQGEHSAILWIFIKLWFVIRIFVCLFLSGRVGSVLLYVLSHRSGNNSPCTYLPKVCYTVCVTSN